MSELDSRNCALQFDEPGNSGQWFNVFIAPNTHVARRDSAVACYSGGFDENERSATDGSAAEMDKVPITGHTFDSTILAHGRHNDPVPERHATGALANVV